RRDLLIEYLHLIQDRYGCLAPGHLAALAEELRLPMAEVYEIATFYAHFDVIDGVGDGAKASDGAILPTVRVCESLCCAMAGAEKLLATLQSDLGGAARVIGAPCMGACANAPAVSIGARQIQDATPIRVTNALAASPPAGAASFPVYKDLKAYRADGGYRLLETCRAGTITPDEVMEALELADLRGMGGAFFPTARKWRLVAGQPGPRIVAINADEGEVGTFKDRYFLETDPHSVLEGMLIAAWAVDAAQVYFYLRDEYGDAREILAREITALGDAGIVGDQVRLELRRGAGAYICGEESAMIESIEGKRGLPRHRPPYVAEVGIFGRPTLVNNVETVYWARQILEKALVDPSGLDPLPEPLAVRAYSISGRVKEPGVKIAPIGLTMTELLQDHCGGMEDGHTFKAYLPGGASGGILPASLADLSLDQDSLIKYGCFVGAAAIVVLSDKDNIAEAALSLMKFFEHESCGQCSPCRVGTAKAVQLMQAEKWDVGLLRELSDVMRDASICGLGQAAPNPLDCVLDHFPEDIPQ
ncbi:MAG: NAD(P)H-dependent oxidoreductase subunit E, partial [Alphaproteobacteria bacterium]|nr:NAD(P)H-dependent oxidoreductase subunit E [Alphaproteobacteria bacterium]